MADTVAQSRTNYFRVKNLDAFKADAAKYGIEFDAWGGDPGAELVLDVSAENTPAGSIALFSYGFWPSFYEDIVADRLEIEDDQTVVLQEYQSIEDLVAAHLVETDVAVFIGFSVEKMRYIDGHALAVNARGERRTIDLQNIYGLAEEIATEGTPVSHASC